ncbi:hypothetical protein ACOMHN_042298 [Nucella lapillus]
MLNAVCLFLEFLKESLSLEEADDAISVSLEDADVISISSVILEDAKCRLYLWRMLNAACISGGFSMLPVSLEDADALCLYLWRMLVLSVSNSGVSGGCSMLPVSLEDADALCLYLWRMLNAACISGGY